MKYKLVIISILISALSILSQSIPFEQIQTRIILNLTANPSSEIAVTWRTAKNDTQAFVQIAEADDWIKFDTTSLKVPANSILVKVDSVNIVFHHSSVIKNLKANTVYDYRVGNEVSWSEWKQFTTAKHEEAPFEFVWFGDAQHDVKKFVSRVFQKAFSTSANAAFWLFSGDLEDRPDYDYQMQEAFDAWGFISSITPQVLAAGNHEYSEKITNGVKEEYLESLWKVHFTQPQNGIASLPGTSFFFDYQGTRFVVLNGNEQLKEQGVWLDQILKNNPNKWSIIAVHQPFYSMGKKRNQKKIHDTFLSIIDKYHVDLVLQGHDHVYSRSKKLCNDKIVGANERGTVFVVSQCGSETYSTESPYTDFAEKLANKIQLFQVISIDKEKIKYKAVTVTGKVFDEFVISK